MACSTLVTRPPITPQTAHLRHVVVAAPPATRPLDDLKYLFDSIRNVRIKQCSLARQEGARPVRAPATTASWGFRTKVPMPTFPKVPVESPASPLFLVVGRETGVRLVTAQATSGPPRGHIEGPIHPAGGRDRGPVEASPQSRTEAAAEHDRGVARDQLRSRATPRGWAQPRLSPGSASAHASFARFGPAPAPPAACSIGGTSGRADFSSPRKLNFFSSPSPSVSTTTM